MGVDFRGVRARLRDVVNGQGTFIPARAAGNYNVGGGDFDPVGVIDVDLVYRIIFRAGCCCSGLLGPVGIVWRDRNFGTSGAGDQSCEGNRSLPGDSRDHEAIDSRAGRNEGKLIARNRM